MAAKLADSVDVPVADAIGSWRLSVRNFRVILRNSAILQFYKVVVVLCPLPSLSHDIRKDGYVYERSIAFPSASPHH